MKKLSCILMALCIAFLTGGAAGAESLPEIVGTYAAGDITLEVNAQVYDYGVTEASSYIATPAAFNADELIAFFWPDADAEEVARTKRLVNEYMVKDGLSCPSEIYEYDGGSLHVGYNTGMALFIARELTEWYTEGKPDTWIDTKIEETECTAPIDPSILDSLVSILGVSYELAPVHSYGVCEYKESGETFTYNVYNYAIMIDGLYCGNQGYWTALSKEDLFVPAQYLEVITNENGLLQFHICLYDVTGGEEFQTIMPCEEAIEYLREELSWYIANDTVSIRSILLEYVMIPIPGSTLKFQYVPAWKFQTAETAWRPYLHLEGRVFRFNAVTGDLIE